MPAASANARSNVTLDGQRMREDPQAALRAEFEDRLGDERQLRFAVERQLAAALKKLARHRRTPAQVVAQNAEAISQRAGEIANQIATGELDPEQGKSALYALQVALSAIRTQDTATAAKRREERLCKTASSKTKSHTTTRPHQATHTARPKPKARGKKH